MFGKLGPCNQILLIPHFIDKYIFFTFLNVGKTEEVSVWPNGVLCKFHTFTLRGYAQLFFGKLRICLCAQHKIALEYIKDCLEIFGISYWAHEWVRQTECSGNYYFKTKLPRVAHQRKTDYKIVWPHHQSHHHRQRAPRSLLYHHLTWIKH